LVTNIFVLHTPSALPHTAGDVLRGIANVRIANTVALVALCAVCISFTCARHRPPFALAEVCVADTSHQAQNAVATAAGDVLRSVANVRIANTVALVALCAVCISFTHARHISKIASMEARVANMRCVVATHCAARALACCAPYAGALFGLAGVGGGVASLRGVVAACCAT